MKLRAIVLAGGAGSRLWPLTRYVPKQLVPFRGSTLLEESLERVAPCVSDGIVISTASIYREATEAIAERYGASVVSEPEPRNTALAIAYVLADEAIADTTILLFMPSDHYIDDSDRYRHVVTLAAQYAADTDLPVLFGVRPTSASSLYGYIQYEHAAREPYSVHSFIEKPHSDVAQALCAQGDVLWNCGMLAVSAGTLRRLYHASASEYYQAACAARGGDFTLWRELPPEPVDRVVLERAEQLLVVPLGCTWADVGSLEQFIAYAGGHYSSSGKRVITDCENIAVIDTEDCIIVAPRNTIGATLARARATINT